MLPRIVIFSCNWDGWSCIESASNLHLQYPSSVKVVRVRCLSRLHAGLMIKPFEFGADGVLLIGCKPENCHFGNNDSYVIKELERAQAILEMLGIWKNRLALVQLPPFDGNQFLARVLNFIDEIRTVPLRGHTKLSARSLGDKEP